MNAPPAKEALTPRQCATVLRALGDETRLRILKSLLVQAKCVTELVHELKRAQPHVSHHLRILRDARLVEGLREGKQVYYRIAPNVHRTLTHREGQALDLGCCQLRFPETVLVNVRRVG